VLSHVFFGLFDADTVVLRDCVELCEAIPELFELVDLLISQFFRLAVLFFQFGQFFGQVGQSLCRVLDLLEHVWLAFLYEAV